jgi:Helicase HerA, central domain
MGAMAPMQTRLCREAAAYATSSTSNGVCFEFWAFYLETNMASHGNDLHLGNFGDRIPVILRHTHRLQHCHIAGLTGTGKSRYLEYLIRQDIRAWPKTHCGMLIIDPHGEMFDGLMAWIAANQLTHLPLIPIDLRRQDQIISYNVLRQRPAEPSVIIDNFVKAMAYVWGQGGTDETPLFERWASNALHALYFAKKTLADAAHLFTPEGLVVAEGIENPMIRRDWLWARRNRKEFETATSSSVNRFRRFLLNPVLRSIFGQSDVSLDLGTALNDGQIILVSLARNGGNVSRENADLFATLLLADLWTAADERGKGEKVKPFYCFIDEFQRFLTPTMAESLAEARGFGIGMTLANQFPRQILNGGPNGARIYDEVMENTRTKVVFRMRTRGNLEPVAEQLFMDSFDPEQVKYQHYSTTVLGQRVGYLPSFGKSATGTTGGGNQVSHTQGKNHSVGSNWAHTDSRSQSTTRSWSIVDSASLSEFEDEEGEAGGTSQSESTGITEGGSETDTVGESDTVGGSETHGTNEADTTGSNTSWSTALGSSVNVSPMLFSVMGKEAAQPLFRSIEEQIFIAMARIAHLKDREAYVLTADMEVPQLIRTPNIERPPISRVCTELAAGWYQRESGLSLGLDVALQRILIRDRDFDVVTLVASDDDIDRPRRRLSKVIVHPVSDA